MSQRPFEDPKQYPIPEFKFKQGERVKYLDLNFLPREAVVEYSIAVYALRDTETGMLVRSVQEMMDLALNNND